MTMTDYQARCIVLAAGIITFGMIVVAWIRDDPYVLHTVGSGNFAVVLNRETGELCFHYMGVTCRRFENFEHPPSQPAPKLTPGRSAFDDLLNQNPG